MGFFRVSMFLALSHLCLFLPWFFFAFFCLGFSLLPLLLDIFKPKNGPPNEVLGSLVAKKYAFCVQFLKGVFFPEFLRPENLFRIMKKFSQGTGAVIARYQGACRRIFLLLSAVNLPTCPSWLSGSALTPPPLSGDLPSESGREKKSLVRKLGFPY